MKPYKERNKKYFLTGIVAVIAFFSLNAGNKETNAERPNTVFSEIDISSYIYISKNAAIVGKENIFVKQLTLENLQANTVEKPVHKHKKNDTSQSVKKPLTQKKPKITICALPFSSDNLSYSNSGKAFATIVPQHRINGSQLVNKINRENRCLDIEDSDLQRYFPELRQKFSPTATQCGILISFGPNSPSMS